MPMMMKAEPQGAKKFSDAVLRLME